MSPRAVVILSLCCMSVLPRQDVHARSNNPEAARSLDVDEADVSVGYQEIGGAPALHIQYRVGSRAEGRLVYADFPDSWAGFTGLWREIGPLAVEGGELRSGEEGRAVVAFAPAQPGELGYSLSSASATPRTGFAQPVFGDGWVFAFGQAALAHLSGVTEYRYTGTVDSSIAPAGAMVQIGYDRLRDSFFIAGPSIRRESFGTSNQHLVYYPVYYQDQARHYRVMADQFMAALARRSGYLPSRLVIAVVPYDVTPGGPNFFGTAVRDGVAFMVSGEAVDHQWAVAHELTHQYTSYALGPIDQNAAFASQRWYFEGVTDMVARQTMLSGEFATTEAWLTQWNQTLRRYDFWRDRSSAMAASQSAEPRQLPSHLEGGNPGQEDYDRGAMAALAAHWALRAGRDDGLFGVLAQINRRRFEDAGRNQDVPAPVAFRSALARADQEVARAFERMLTGTSDAAPPVGQVTRCLTLETVSRPVFERGFEVSVNADGTYDVQSVKAESRAAAAGIEPGMRIIRLISGEPGNPLLPYVFDVEDNGLRRQIRYLPQGNDIERYRQWTTTPFARTTRGDRYCRLAMQ